MSSNHPNTPSPILIAGVCLCGLLISAGWIWGLREPPLPDFSTLAVTAKKQQFFDYLGPKISQINTEILQDRAHLERIEQRLDEALPSWLERHFLQDLAATYKLRTDASVETHADYLALIAALRLRVDIIPASLTMVQAAKESGWGTSNFARQGNNLFGQQCFTQGCGFVPRGREPGRTHEVARFSTVAEALRAYFRNLNTHPRYEAMRQIRAQLRNTGSPINGTQLADGLLAYSERREAYVQEVKDMIRQNKLE